MADVLIKEPSPQWPGFKAIVVEVTGGQRITKEVELFGLPGGSMPSLSWLQNWLPSLVSCAMAWPCRGGQKQNGHESTDHGALYSLGFLWPSKPSLLVTGGQPFPETRCLLQNCCSLVSCAMAWPAVRSERPREHRSGGTLSGLVVSAHLPAVDCACTLGTRYWPSILRPQRVVRLRYQNPTLRPPSTVVGSRVRRFAR